MITMDDKQIRKFEKKLGKFKLALPIANQQALTAGAKDAQAKAKKKIQKTMVTRNKWTENSVKVVPAKGLFMSAQAARVGSVQPYMADQEFGATAGKQGKEGRRITTSYAAGQGLNARPRTKTARGKNKIARIKLRNKRSKGKSKRQRALVSIRQAAKSGRKYVYLDMPWTKGKKGIYKVIGGKRRPRIKMVHSLKQKRVVIPRNPWLKPAVDEVIPRMPRHYKQALIKQAKRHLR